MVVAEKTYALLPGNPNQKLRVRKKQKAVLYIRMVGLTLGLFGLGLLYTYQHTRVISLGYQINAIKQNIATLQRDNKKLELTIAGLQAPKRVESIARQRLGMKEPDGVLLAEVPAEPVPPESSSEKSQNRLALKKVLGLVADRLIGKAEASPR